jgi:hypothetical protein
LTSEENGIVVKVVSKSGDEYTVEIDQIEEISITESSEARAFTSLQMDLNKDFDVCISHVYHPGRFYVQIIENATIIDSLMEKISNEFNSNPNLSSLSNGMVGIAKLSDGACKEYLFLWLTNTFLQFLWSLLYIQVPVQVSAYNVMIFL